MSQDYLMSRQEAGDTIPYGYTPFGPVLVQLRRLSEAKDMDYSHLYRVFHGQRQPGLQYARTLAECLDMPLSEFLTTLDSLKQN